MKGIVLALSVFLSLASISQNNYDLISSNAVLVMDMNGKNVTDKLTIKEIEQSYMFAQLVKELDRKENFQASSLADFGVDPQKNITFAMEEIEGKSLLVTILPLSNKSKFEAFIKEIGPKSLKGIKKGKYVSYETDDSNNDYILVGKNLAVILFAPKTYNQYSYDYESSNDRWKSVDRIMNIYLETGDFSQAQKAMPKEAEWLAKRREERRTPKGEISETEKEEMEKALKEALEEAITETATTNNNPYPEDYYTREQEVRNYFDSLEGVELENLQAEASKKLKVTIDNRGKEFFSGKVKKSITTDPSFKMAINDQADGTFWASGNGYQALMKAMNPYRYRNATQATTSISNYGHVYFEKDKAVAKLHTPVDARYGSMYSKKIDSRLLGLIKNDAIGYGVIAMNTKAWMEQLPNAYLAALETDPYTKDYMDEFSLAADFFSIVIDEQEISELVTGDAVFVLNGLEMKEVSYQTYEYDENYNWTEVTKTKKEPVPSFSFGMTSKKPEFVNKIMNYAVKKGGLVKNGDYYELSEKMKKEVPFELYMGYANDVLISTTSLADLKAVLNNKTKSTLDKKAQDIVANSNMTIYYNNQKLFEILPSEEISSPKDRQTFDYVYQNTRDAFITQSFGTNEIITDLTVNIPNGETNSAKYMFQLFDKMIEIQTKK